MSEDANQDQDLVDRITSKYPDVTREQAEQALAFVSQGQSAFPDMRRVDLVDPQTRVVLFPSGQVALERR